MNPLKLRQTFVLWLKHSLSGPSETCPRVTHENLSSKYTLSSNMFQLTPFTPMAVMDLDSQVEQNESYG